jgi:NS3 serine protease
VDYGGRSAIFRGQIVADVPSQGGDSGSLVVDDRGRAVGLLFAGSASTTLINPIGAISELLDVVIG